MTVDGTDFVTVEYTPFTSERLTYKHNTAGLRYEIALAIQNCWIVHINGPFKPGIYNDLMIARRDLHYKLPPGEFYLADDGYRARNVPSITLRDLPAYQRPRMQKLRSRHETINRRFKEWGILHQTFRNEDNMHGPIFRCIAVLVQMDIMSGNLVFNV